MDKDHILNKIKSFFSDSIWSILALMMLNIISQFIVYPVWSRYYGNEKYGNIVYAMSLVNICAVSVGVALNYARMSESSKRTTVNGDYNIPLVGFGFLSSIFCFFMVLYGNIGMTVLEAIVVAILCFVTVCRYYADVEYRLNLNYKGYFIYYLIISFGYAIGIILFKATKCWPIALLIGEIFGIIWIVIKGRLFRNLFKISKNWKINIRAILILILTNLISNIIFNGDRLLLQYLIGGVAVTIYYLASLVGKTMSLITTPLNSVCIGYLVKYRGDIKKSLINFLFVITILGIILGTVVGVIGSHILIQVLYPQTYDLVKGYFVIGTLTQVLYFVCNIVTTVLLRIAKENIQLIINGIYAVLFILLCIPSTLYWGIRGFCIALLIVNLLRYFIAIAFCYAAIKNKSVKGK
ncbi:lipopolysaccharide biosynthesis protein [Murimonas intestini]|uniref:O-antigen/teichoic acid export membrane protein n=1 Tax=Murimonas intestini TaxID=1337051 RepID=A0AB73SZ03_9FIRM|nr:hypothetical protein [Murimonas intestini]MCR1842968.1 hypothetical protein [Murimonas intestini]MCR1864783.1 hypothetical protein [Murimonas intestini]MCR1885437.1 hypothetical protein [Murimonas intestini]